MTIDTKNILDLFIRWKYLFLFLLLFVIVLTQRFENKHINGLINSVSSGGAGSDGAGYYSYLPAAIIYQDFSYEFYGKPENKINGIYWPYHRLYKGHQLNKYYCGVSICLLPFFLFAIVISYFAGTAINGYTDTFLMMVSIAPLIYFLLSVFLLKKIGDFFKVSSIITYVSVFIIFFGTILFHYVIQEPSMSHIYSFFAVSLFFFTFSKLVENINGRNILYVFIALSLVALVRPPNVIVVLFTPFFFDNFKTYFLFIRKVIFDNKLMLVVSVLVFFLIFSIQYLLYYLQTGEIFVEAYQGETFNFKSPEIFNTLFSYRKGLFTYTPILFFIIILILFSKISLYKKVIFAFTFSIFTYITASWWCWYYGGCFGNRPFVDIMPVFIITLIVVLQTLQSVKFRKVLAAGSLFFIFTNQIMAYQYINSILPKDNTTREKYWDIFLNPSLKSINDKAKETVFIESKILKFSEKSFEDPAETLTTDFDSFDGKRSCVLSKNNNFTPSIGFNLYEVTQGRSFYVVAEIYFKEFEKAKDLGLALSLNDGNDIIKWDYVWSSQFPEEKNGWKKVTQVARIDAAYVKPNTYLKVFAMSYKGKSIADKLSCYIIAE